MNYFNLILGIIIGVILGSYLVIRICNIKKEIKTTGKVKNNGLIEVVLKKELHEKDSKKA